MDFSKYDEHIGVEGYFEHFRKLLFPFSTEHSIDLAKFRMEARTYAEGGTFTRVRNLKKNVPDKFYAKNVKVSEFFPPDPLERSINIGRFNKENESVIYLADSIETAISECNIEVGDYFLYTNLSLLKDMSFIALGFDEEEGAFSKELLKLINSKDRGFYPVITQVYNYFLSFTEMNGATYPSVRLDDYGFKSAKSKINLAINGNERNNVKFVGGYLLYLSGRDLDSGEYNIEQVAIYSPNNSKKKNKNLKITIYKNNPELFKKLSINYYKSHEENKEKAKKKLEKSNLNNSDLELFKMIQRKK